MRRIILKYRIKLNSKLVFQTPFFAFFNGTFSAQESDLEIKDITGRVICPFSNPDLIENECYEGIAQVTFKGNIKDYNLRYYLYNGNYSIDSYDDIGFVFQLEDYAIYKNDKNHDYYVVRSDLQAFSSDLEMIWPKLLESFLLVFDSFYGVVSPDVFVSPLVLSEDKKIAKFKVNGLYYLEEFSEAKEVSLNRILPS